MENVVQKKEKRMNKDLRLLKIGVLIQDMRKKQNLTQEQLALKMRHHQIFIQE